MTSFYILLAIASLGSVLLYLSLHGILKILDQIKSSIIGICLIMFLTASIYLVLNREQSDELLEKIQFWKTESIDRDSDDYHLFHKPSKFYNMWFLSKKDNYARPAVHLPNTKDNINWAELFHGLICTGSAGSGKTSGVLSEVLDQVLKDNSHPGGLLLCVKKDERVRLEKAIRKAGRSDDLIIIDKHSSYSINVLEHELYRNGKQDVEYTHALSIIMEIFLMGEHYDSGGGSSKESERFWEKGLRRALSRAMMLLVLCEQTVSIENMRQIMIDSFSDEEVSKYLELLDSFAEDYSPPLSNVIEEYLAWKDNNYFLFCLDKMNAREDLTTEEEHTRKLVCDYYLKTWPSISDRTRAIIEESAMGLYEPFLTGILRSHFSETMSVEINPSRCFEEGKLLLVDFSIKEYGISSIYAVGALKKLFQLCMERRIVELEDKPRPSFIFCDEYHFLVSPISDEKFQSSCRSTMTAGIYAFQSINALKIAMGHENADAKTKSFLANVGTKIACCNSDRDTNEFMSSIIGKTRVHFNSSSINTDHKGSHSSSERLEWIVPPEHYCQLSSGGSENNYNVETIIHVIGKKWTTDENFREVTFKQKFAPKSIFNSLKSFFL